MKNKDLIRDIIKQADKVEELESYYEKHGRTLLRELNYRGLELANILCQDYEGEAENVNILAVSKWYDNVKMGLEILQVSYK